MTEIIIFSYILLGVLSSFIYFFYKTLKLSKDKGNKEGVRNSICCIIIIITFDFLYVIYSLLLGYPIIPYPFDALMLIWVGMILSAQLLFKKFHKKTELPSVEYISPEDFTLKLEIKRKITHTVILLLIAVYLGFGYLVYDFIDNTIHISEDFNFNIWGITELDFPREHSIWMVSIFGVFGAIILIIIPEIFRIFSPEDYMLYRVTELMREKEQYGIGAPLALSMGALVPVLAIPYVEISMAAIAIAVLGDAAASLVGRKYGKHKISSFPSKSYEGLFGGVIIGFVFGFLVLIFTVNVFVSLLLALIGAILLGLIDLSNLKISDNILNPIIIAFGIFLFSLVFYI